MDKKKPERRISQPWAKEDLEVSDKEVTLRGREHQDEMRNDSMITGVDEYATRVQHNIHKLQNRALIGLALVLLGVLIIVMVLAIGVGVVNLTGSISAELTAPQPAAFPTGSPQSGPDLENP